MRILVLSFYYPPDLGPGPFRASALVEALREILPADTHIDVVTTMPNRYSGFNAAAPALEELPGLTLHRINLPAHQSGMLDQSKAFLTYARNAVKIARQNKYDLVLATSSRLMTAALGAWISRRTGACLYLDIRDIFVDTIKDVLPKRFARVAKPLFSVLEGWTMRRASKINLVSAGFGEYFSTRYPRQPYSFFTNGIDDEFLPEALPLAAPAQEKSGKILSVLYAGNIGEGQGLHTILPPLAARMHGRLHFNVIGDGGRRAALQAALTQARVDNVTLMAPMKRSELIAAYRDADVLFVHLNDYAAFKKVLPSKLFEYGAIGKPIWAGVDGYAAQFVATEIPNAAVFYPCDVDAAVNAFDSLRLHDMPRPEFITKFSRKNIVRAMARDIVTLLPPAAGECGAARQIVDVQN